MENQKEFLISGTKLTFPNKPYPSQFSMMHRIIHSLDAHENCLIESPTGSGKTLALLCSTLAWQKKEIRINLEKARLEDEKMQNLKMEFTGQSKTPINEPKIEEPKMTAYESPFENNTLSKEDQKDLDDFQPVKKRIRILAETMLQPSSDSSFNSDYEMQIHTLDSPLPPTLKEEASLKSTKSTFNEGSLKSTKSTFKDEGSLNSTKSTSKEEASLKSTLKEEGSLKSTLKEEACLKSTLKEEASLKTPKSSSISKYFKKDDTDLKNQDENKIPTQDYIKYPKIFFGTRTHTQVSQIVRELNKTAYKDVKMCVLSSRDRTCINPIVTAMPNKNEGCKELLKGYGCSYFTNAGALTQETIKSCKTGGGKVNAWDLEDLVRVGKKIKACPFYAIRKLVTTADIIIGPYNYFLDASIRSSIGLMLKNGIIILDEAHNIEEAAREASSLSLSLDQMTQTVRDLEELSMANVEYRVFREVAKVFSGLCSFINQHSDSLNEYQEFDRGSKVLSGQELVAVLTLVGAGPEKIGDLNRSLHMLLEDQKQIELNGNTASSNIVVVLQSFLLVLGLLYKNDMQYMSDYRAVILKVATSTRNSLGGWKQKKATGSQWVINMNIWCMNPGVAFEDLVKDLHSLIVTSGTLSPMNTFQSELAVPFQNQLEANHVIKKSQAWVGTIGKGPKDISLNIIYKNIETFQFQDEVGEVVLGVCKAVPHGILCFFSSYSVMQKLENRWKQTGLYSKLTSCKIVVSEPRGGNREDFDDVMHQFYEAVNDGTGALFLAVCRGKVSEGLDFSDDNARAVITIGIPFPNFKDIQVDLKKRYNNSKRNEKALMSGHEWYETQGFRALNQALGRCIRHRDDWGALIIVDERFQTQPRYTNNLSKWVRESLFHYKSYESAIGSLKAFCLDNANTGLQSLSSNLSPSRQFSETPATPKFQWSTENSLLTPLSPDICEI